MRPGEVAGRVGLGPEGEPRVAVRDEAILVVPGQRTNGPPDLGCARVITVAHGAETVARAQAGVGRLRPCATTVERKVDAGGTDAGREGASRIIARVAGFQINIVIRARDEDVRMIGIYRQGGFILFVL